MEYKEYKKMVEERGYRVYNVHGWLLLEKKDRRHQERN